MMIPDEQRLCDLKEAYRLATERRDNADMLDYGEQYYRELYQRELTIEDKELLQNEILEAAVRKD